MAVKRKGKVYDKKSYTMEKEITRIKEYTLEKTYSFMENFYNAFKEPLPPEEAVERFKGFFPSEKEFYTHVKKHAVPRNLLMELAKHLNLKPEQISHTLIKSLPEIQKFVFDYFIDTLTALAYPTLSVYQELQRKKTEPRIVIYSGFRRRIVVTLHGSQIISSFKLRKEKFSDWLADRKEKDKLIVEVGIDERIQRMAIFLRDVLRRYKGTAT